MNKIGDCKWLRKGKNKGGEDKKENYSQKNKWKAIEINAYGVMLTQKKKVEIKKKLGNLNR